MESIRGPAGKKGRTPPKKEMIPQGKAQPRVLLKPCNLRLDLDEFVLKLTDSPAGRRGEFHFLGGHHPHTDHCARDRVSDGQLIAERCRDACPRGAELLRTRREPTAFRLVPVCWNK